MARLVAAFEERGYRWAYRVVSSLGFIPQRRERVFLVASSRRPRSLGRALPRRRGAACARDQPRQPRPRLLLDRRNAGPRLGARRGADAQERIDRRHPLAACILLPSGLVVEARPPRRRAPAGISGGLDRRGGGSRAEQPAVVAGRQRGHGPRGALARRTLRPPRPIRHRPSTARSPGRRWPSAARGDGRKRHAVAIGKFPWPRTRPPLHRFLRHPGSPLSARATRGFLARADAGNLRFVPGFIERVRAHAADHGGGPAGGRVGLQMSLKRVA